MNKTAKTYGSALYDLALEEALTSEIMGNLDLMKSEFHDNPLYLKLLQTPSISKEERKSLMDEAFSASVHPYCLNFLKLLCDNDTLREFEGCIEEYRVRYYADQNILPVKVFSAMPVSKEMEEKLISRLETKTKKKILLSYSIDPNLLGGIRIEMQGREYDGTARHHLDELQKLLTNPNNLSCSE